MDIIKKLLGKKVITKLPLDLVEKKIQEFKLMEENEKKIAVRDDPTLFAYTYLKDPLKPWRPLRVYEWQNLFLNNPSYKILVCIARQTGKSLALCIKILHKIVFAKTDQTILVFSRGEKQAQDILYKLKLLMRHVKGYSFEATLKTDSKSELYKKNGNGTECRVISEVATTSALGHSPHAVYLDEFSYVENDQDFYEHIVLPMVAKTKGDIVITSTPRDTNSYFYNIYKNNKTFDKYHFDYHACPDYTDEWAAERKDEMDIINYRSEVLAEFVSGAVNQYYPAEIVDAAISDKIDQTVDSNKTYYIGVDWGQMTSRNVITIISHIRVDEVTNDVEIVEIITAPQGTKYSAIIGEVKSLNDKYNVAKVFCDRGAGQGQIDMLQEKLGINVEGIAFTIQSKVDMNSNLKKLIEKKEIKLPRNKQLTDELKAFQYEFTSTSKMKLHGKPDDHVDSLALACMGISQHKPVSLVIIPKKSVIALAKDKIQHDLRYNTPQTKMLFCEKCAKAGVVNCYFEIEKEDYVKDKEYFCPEHS